MRRRMRGKREQTLMMLVGAIEGLLEEDKKQCR